MENFINEYFFIIIILIIIIHFIIGFILNRAYYEIEKKSTPMAFIPLANLYLIGSLSCHNIIGSILVIITLLNSSFPLNIDDKIVVKRILPENINEPLWIITIIFIGVLLITLIFKQKKYEDDNIRDDRFLTEAELMKEPSYLKKQAKLEYKQNGLTKKESIFMDKNNPKPFPTKELNNKVPPRNPIEMPKPFNSQPFNNQNQLPNNNPFNNRKF